MTKAQINYFKDIFKARSFSNNFYLFIFVLAFIIIAIDLGSETAAEKDEIGTVLCIFEDTDLDMHLSVDILTDIERPFLFEIPIANIFPQEINTPVSINERGPPDKI